MKVCCSNPNCTNAGKIFDDSTVIEDIRKRRVCTVCHQTSLVPTESNVHCSGCGDECDVRFLRRYYKIRNRKGMCCCEGCLARTLLYDCEVDVYIKGRQFVPVGLI